MYVHNLTDGELRIEFNTLSKLKDGRIKEDFNVTVLNKNGSNSYKGNSGGEKAKADLAINFTISDLIAARAKKSYPQRFFDEPFESLDESGIEAVMELLSKMVHQCGSIFVVTHQSIMKGMFDKIITVTKERGVTRILN
jgi:DNA repair exonuclease SbcCD ATPase subunit